MADKEQESTGGYGDLFPSLSSTHKSQTINANHFPRLLRGYLASAKSYIPGMGQVSDTATSGAGKAQEGLGAAGYVFTSLIAFQPLQPQAPALARMLTYYVLVRSATKDVTGYVPVVGSIVEGVGNTPVAQKLGGKEEEKGYLGSAYEYAGSALRTVYDAAGNAVRIPFHPINSFVHSSRPSLNTL